MEKRKRTDIIHIDEENSVGAVDLFLKERQNGNLSQHRSCWLHLAAYQYGVKGKLTDRDMTEIKNFERMLPCLSKLRTCCQRSKSSSRGLIGQRWKMSDGIFNNHLENIWSRLSDGKKASCAHVDSLCFFLYQYKKPLALELIKRENIFSKKYVFVPIVCWDHWRLLVFCHFGEDANSETKTRCILLLDSIEWGAQSIGPDVRKFVFDIFKAAGRPENQKVINQIPLLVPKVPQQTNDVDCGRFVLYFIRKFMEAAPEDFSISNGYPYFMKPDWFNHRSFENFCNKLEREIPTHKQDVQPRRTLQRIRNGRALSRKSSRQDVELVVLEVD